MQEKFMRVYGVNQKTGEYKLVYHAITWVDWLRTGLENAVNHHYAIFQFFNVPSLENGFNSDEIIL